MATTKRASVSFTKRTIGTYAGQWTIVGRKGAIQPKLEAADRHGKAIDLVTIGEHEIENGVVRTVFVEVAWRLPHERLTEAEVAAILAIAAEKIGAYVVID